MAKNSNDKTPASTPPPPPAPRRRVNDDMLDYVRKSDSSSERKSPDRGFVTRVLPDGDSK